jgi:hypothetical protein
MTQAEAPAKIEEAEAQVHLASIAGFEWGCDVAVHTSPTSVVVAPVGAVQGSPAVSLAIRRDGSCLELTA